MRAMAAHKEEEGWVKSCVLSLTAPASPHCRDAERIRAFEEGNSASGAQGSKHQPVIPTIGYSPVFPFYFLQTVSPAPPSRGGMGSCKQCYQYTL